MTLEKKYNTVLFGDSISEKILWSQLQLKHWYGPAKLVAVCGGTEFDDYKYLVLIERDFAPSKADLQAYAEWRGCATAEEARIIYGDHFGDLAIPVVVPVRAVPEFCRKISPFLKISTDDFKGWEPGPEACPSSAPKQRWRSVSRRARTRNNSEAGFNPAICVASWA